MRRSLTAHCLLASFLLLVVSLTAGGGAAIAADAFGLGLERLKSARAATHVEADQIEYQEQRKVVIGRGDVMVRFGDRILYADELRVDLEAQEFVATGHVLLVEGPNRLEGDRLEFNYGTNLGVIHNARGFLYPNTTFRGLEIRKVGEREYRVLQGAYTSCRVCQPEPDLPSWELRGEEITLVQDEVFLAKHVTGWVLDTLPVLYSPVFSVPLGPRRSGFLFPRLGYGNTSGFTYRQPFYWAISESQDATITGTFRSKRGFEIGANYRYILSPRAFGEWSGSYLRDRDKAQNERNRWEVHGLHSQLFSPTLSLKSDINFQSDNSFGRDFVDRTFVQRTARTIQSNVFLTQAAEVYNAMLRTDVSRDLTDTQDTRLMRLPEFRFHLFDRPLASLPLAVGGVGSATYFERRNAPDAVRADIAPHLRVPWAPAPWLGSIGTAGVRETVYSVGNEGFSGTPTRSLYDLGAGVEARFLRVFEVGGRELSQIVHVVAPRVGYQYIPFVDQQRFPQSDAEDFVSPQNHFTYGLENRFIARLRDEEGRVTSREVLRLGVVQAFNFRPRTRVFSDHYLTALTPERVDNAVTNVRPVPDAAGNPTGFSRADERQFTNLVFSLQASPHPLIFFRGDVGLNTAKAAEEAINLQLRFRYPGWGFLALGYTHADRQALEAYTGSIGASFTPELSVEYMTRYDARQRVFLEHNMVARYGTCCWEVSLRYVNRERGPTFRTENDVRVVFELKTGRTQQAPAPGPPLATGTAQPGPGSATGTAQPGPGSERSPAPGSPAGGSGGLVDGPPTDR